MKEEHTNHEQSFAKCATPLPQNLVWAERNDVTEGEDEWVDVFHVKVVGRNCIGYGVLSENLGLFHCIPGEGFRMEGEIRIRTYGVISSGSSSRGW